MSEELIKRLREKLADSLLAGLPYNRDGGEAADLIETQAREIEQWKVDYTEAALDVERLTKWKPIGTAPDDDWFLAAIEVRHKNGGHWWEYHVVWLDDETGDIHTDCEQGWSITDYSHWMALPDAPYPLNAARAALGESHD
ncbi:MAG: hypothetical protein RLZZ387_2605 [Chloroflexota bacterium]|jgi:hypothetical protein